jgi:hypothetical protein
VEEDHFREDWLQCFATAMLDAKYEYVNVHQVIDTLSHVPQYAPKSGLATRGHRKGLERRVYCALVL